MPEPRPPEAIVLGAGIAGLSLASHLARRGVAATVVDPNPRTFGATGRAAGIVTEQLWSPWDIEVTREAHAEAQRLLDRQEPRAYWGNGFLRFTRQGALVAPLRAALRRLRDAGVEAQLIDAAALRELLPFGSFPDDAVGLYGPDDGCVTPSALAEAYAAAARRDGAELWDGAGPIHVAREGDGWSVRGGSRTVRARRLVVAAGAWSKKLLNDLGHALPLCPYRMQAALLKPSEPPPENFPSVHDLDADVYVRPELAGRVLAGDGTEATESDPERFERGGDPEFLGHLATSLEGPFPAWAAASVVSAWAGVCTSTPDRRPLVGPVPGAPGLFVMTGFNGFGVMRAGGIANRLARALESDRDAGSAWEPLAPVLPARFPKDVPTFRPRPGFTLEAGDDPRF